MSKVNELSFMHWCQQAAALLEAGIDLANVIRMTAAQTKEPSMKRILLRVNEKILQGSYLHEVLLQEKNLPHYYAALIKNGEETGKLGKALHQLGDYIEKRCARKQNFKKALTYPTLLAIGMLAVIILFTRFVLPMFVELFQSQEIPLPRAMQIWLEISKMLFNYKILILQVCIFILLKISYSFSLVFRRRFQLFLSYLPWVGKLIKLQKMVDFCESFSLLLAADIPIVSALQQLSKVFEETMLYEEIETMRSKIMKGHSLTESLETCKLIHPFLKELIASGEKAGNLTKVLVYASEFIKKETDAETENFITWLEPTLTLGMAGCVGGLLYMVVVPLMNFSLQII
jgi:type IV pilus assembly protein PilC